jgi:hypothetical protein
MEGPGISALGIAGRYVIISLPFTPSTLNSKGYCVRKCFKPRSVFFKCCLVVGERATPSMLRRS